MVRTGLRPVDHLDRLYRIFPADAEKAVSSCKDILVFDDILVDFLTGTLSVLLVQEDLSLSFQTSNTLPGRLRYGLDGKADDIEGERPKDILKLFQTARTSILP